MIDRTRFQQKKPIGATANRFSVTTKADMDKTFRHLYEEGISVDLKEFKLDISSGNMPAELWLRDYYHSKRLQLPYITFEFGFSKFSKKLWGEIFSQIKEFCTINSYIDDVLDLEIVIDTPYQLSKHTVNTNWFSASNYCRDERKSIYYDNAWVFFQHHHDAIGRISLGYLKRDNGQSFILRIEDKYVSILKRIFSVLPGQAFGIANSPYFMFSMLTRSRKFCAEK